MLQFFDLVIFIQPRRRFLQDILQFGQPPLFDRGVRCFLLGKFQLWRHLALSASIEIPLGQKRLSGSDALQVLRWQDNVVVLEPHVHDAHVLRPVVLQLVHIVNRLLVLKSFQESLVLLMNGLLLELELQGLSEIDMGFRVLVPLHSWEQILTRVHLLGVREVLVREQRVPVLYDLGHLID